MLYEASVSCPYCSESFVLEIDLSGGREQKWIYDCEICCKPIDIDARFDEENETFQVEASRD